MKSNSKYRVYEISNNGKSVKDHKHFDNVKDAKAFAKFKFFENSMKTFVVNYVNKDKLQTEIYYGKWRR